ncbi:hypothetical protein WJX73_007917 [Symbiochloris irregularis]|uniref:Uncharacterized protein n=1 Tax=Symbiochloris irregularis TaxID=706552 RepID=A0AAW1NMW6_9CHLO
MQPPVKRPRLEHTLIDAREAILQAAREAAQIDDPDAPQASQQQAGAGVAASKAASGATDSHTREQQIVPMSSGQLLAEGARLFESITPQLRQTVPYKPSAKVPRVNRQTLLQRLTGQYTALQLHAQQRPLDAANMTPELIKEAFRLAEAQENALFKRCSSKQVYLNLAAREIACLPAKSPSVNPSAEAAAQSTCEASQVETNDHDRASAAAKEAEQQLEAAQIETSVNGAGSSA